MKYINFIKKKISGREFKSTCHGFKLIYRIDVNDIDAHFNKELYIDTNGGQSGYSIDIKNVVIISGGVYYNKEYTIIQDGIELNSIYLNRVLHSKIYNNVIDIISCYRVGEYIRLTVNHPNIKFI